MWDDGVLPLFRKPAQSPTDAELKAASVDLERIRRGGIPLGAEQRLKAVGRSDAAVFSSDLSSKEYALAQASGLTPLAQVMGSSVVQHGWQSYGWSSLRGGVQELESFAQPWNLARRRAFQRLGQEAAFAGADAVIGIELSAKGFFDQGSVEYMVIGTAVRESTLAAHASGPPRMCTLSGQDVDKLRRSGAEPVGVVGHTAVVVSALSMTSNRMMGAWWGNQEMVEVTRGVYAARQLAMNAVREQGRMVDANVIVISTLTHDIHHHEYEQPGFTQHYFIVSMHVLGSAIRLGVHQPHPAPLGPPMLSLNLST